MDENLMDEVGNCESMLMRIGGEPEILSLSWGIFLLGKKGWLLVCSVG
jgi:hypothetical protein